jgi:hypothetical protein
MYTSSGNTVLLQLLLYNVACQTASWLSRVPIRNGVFHVLIRGHKIIDRLNIVTSWLMLATHFNGYIVNHFLNGVLIYDLLPAS